MKKLLFVLAASSALVFTGCKDDDDDVVTYDIAGSWHPIKVVITDVGDGVSNSISQDYTLCQQQGKWNFNEDTSGSIATNEQVNGECEVINNQNFSYTYNKKGGEISMNFQNLYMRVGRVAFNGPDVMNLKIENTTNGIYHSETITMKRAAN